MKRWNVQYGPDGEVWKVRPAGRVTSCTSQSFITRPSVQGGVFYCSAVDELGALARFVEAWRKKKEQRQ